MNDFILTLDHLGNTQNGNVETLFAQANGFIGVRASLPILAADSTPGSFVNGFYEQHEIIYGENAYGYAKNHQTMVKLFDMRSIELSIDGETVEHLMSRDLRLNMQEGVLYETYHYKTKSGKSISIDLESFTSHADRRVYAQKWVITAVNFSGKVSVKKTNRQIIPLNIDEFDPRHKEAATLLDVIGNEYRTKNSEMSLFTKFDDYEATHELNQDETIRFECLSHISHENVFSDSDFDTLKDQQVQIFKAFWDTSDVEIVGDPELQIGIRTNLYHIFNSAGRDGWTNFGAKGLTGEGYEGHYFWDTEMYLLPFFIYTQPEVAKSLLTYRLNILPKALERAQEMGYAGALYAWRTINGEETSAFFPAGTAQMHINADIVYSFKLYQDVTGDLDFIEDAQDVIFETARFWMDYGFMTERGFEIHEVTGPDEYTALVNNNYYTNKMVQNNLRFAVELADRYGRYQEEAVAWDSAAEAMYFPYDDAKQLTSQDDSFLSKQIWDFEGTPTDNYPLLLHYHPMVIYKYQVLKQADTVLAHMLFPIDDVQVARDFDYYEPLTTHDSSLSRAVYGVVASRLGRDELAYNFFKDSATMDLSDIQGNASHGIHAANMGGMWLGLIYGFAGLQYDGQTIKTQPHLPQAIQSMKFKVIIKGKIQEITIEN